jgi:hypothetical protein
VHNLEDRQKVKTNLESTATHRQWWLAPPRTYGLRVGYAWMSGSAPF